MKKYILGLVMVFVLSFLLVPSFSFAQRTSLGGSRSSNNNTTTTGSSTTTTTNTGGSVVAGDVDPNPDASQCLSLVNNLRYKDRDVNKNGEVSTLQDFLQSAGYLNSEPTGYFGLMTQKAVKSFQSANGISPTGYVGPLTRAKIKNISCGDVVIDDTKGECAISKFTVNGSSSANIKIDEGATLAWETVNCTSIKISSISGSSPLPLSGTQFLYHPQTGAILLYAYKNDSLAKIKSVNVVVGATSDPSITVLSPNGGETWQRDTTQKITWKANQTNEGKYFSVELVTGNSVYNQIASYTLVSHSYGSSGHDWTVGSYMANDGYRGFIPDGKYKIRVCVIDQNNSSGICDDSNNYFTITSSITTGPTISGISGPETLNVGQQGTWIVNAYDNSIPGSSGNLSYSVVWGDAGVACPSGASCSLVPTAPLQHSATFTHTYSTAGNYTPTFYVTNGNGKTSQTSLSVRVGGVVAYYPGFIMKTDKLSYLLSDTLSLILSRYDGNTTLYPVDLYIQNSATNQIVSVQKNLGVAVNTIKSIKLNDFVSSVGEYIIAICSAGQTCNSSTNSNSIKFTIAPPTETNKVACVTFPCFFDGKAITNSWGTVDVPSDSVSAQYPYEFNLSSNTEVQMTLRSNVWPSDPSLSNTMYVELDNKIVFQKSKTNSQSIADQTSNNTIDKIQFGQLSAGKHYIKIYAMPDSKHFHFDWFNLEKSNIAPPHIDSVFAPESLSVGQQGTWTIYASDPNNKSLTYKVFWGDEISSCGWGANCAAPVAKAFSQFAKITHTYTTAGVYKPNFIITNSDGKSVEESNWSVKVISSTAPINTLGGSLSSNALNAFDGLIGNTNKEEANNAPVLVDSELSCKIYSILSKGMDNQEVKCLQQLLNEKGFDVEGTAGGKEITFFGYNTLMAVKKFQASVGLTTDGIVGVATRKLLTE